MRLEGKVALLTGAASGIGAATAELFVKEGAKVVVADRNIEQARRVASALGDRALAVGVDVVIAQQISDAVGATVEAFGGLDILVNNAGLGIRGSVVSTLEEDWDRIIDVNLKSVYLCSKYAIPEIAKRGKGAIVNISSTAAMCGIPDRAAYVASKGGVAALTRSMALDHADQNIRINSIAPGVIWSSYYEKMLKEVPDPEGFVNGLKARAPINRMGQPHEIATMALFLASEESSFATGAIFTVDGGYTAR
ncbi:SDR family oxidoreductase [Paraburkholderia sp. MM5477-R1]|uniref:SDR family oxidoreductase n=1 Tax=Paraburkholderia sp. MM5477-R1 TaxID=2991062 RepID=UPI003D1CB4A1